VTDFSEHVKSLLLSKYYAASLCCTPNSNCI